MEKTGTREWSDRSFNIQTGCEHDCVYCYAKAQAIRFKKATAASWRQPILREIPNKGLPRFTQVMFPTTHDITPKNAHACFFAIQALIERRNRVLVVTKANHKSMKFLCKALERHKPLIEFRITIGSPDDTTLKHWEPNAPSFKDRLNSLQFAHEMGYKTSVSAEPLLCKTEEFQLLHNAVYAYITEGIWVGKLNNCGGRVGVNTAHDEGYNTLLHPLMSDQNDKNILALYNKYKDDPLVKWKDSIRVVIAKQAVAKETVRP